MQRDAILDLVKDLDSLPESDQQRVLALITSLKVSQLEKNERNAESDMGLILKNGFLVFTGTIGAPEVDWLQVTRDERDAQIMAQAIGRSSA